MVMRKVVTVDTFEDSFIKGIDYTRDENQKTSISCRNMPQALHDYILRVADLEQQSPPEVMRHATKQGLLYLQENHKVIQEYEEKHKALIAGEMNDQVSRRLKKLRRLSLGGFEKPVEGAEDKIPTILWVKEEYFHIKNRLGFPASYLASVGMMYMFRDTSKHITSWFAEEFSKELEKFIEDVEIIDKILNI